MVGIGSHLDSAGGYLHHHLHAHHLYPPEVMFLDLHKAVRELDSFENITDPRVNKNFLRASQLAIKFKGARIVAVGGFPITRGGTRLQWAGNTLYSPNTYLRMLLSHGLGLSAIPTYMNKSEKTLGVLGRMCAKKKHLWAYKWMTVSILLCGYGREAELAFARDTNFYLGWPVDTEPGIAFVVNGSLSAWLKFTNRGSDKSFHRDARKAMNESLAILRKILPGEND